MVDNIDCKGKDHKGKEILNITSYILAQQTVKITEKDGNFTA